MRRKLQFHIIAEGSSAKSEQEKEDYRIRADLLDELLLKNKIKDINHIILTDDQIEITKRMCRQYSGGSAEVDCNKIAENLPTGNEELDKTLYFYLNYKDILKLKNLRFVYYVEYKKSDLLNFPLLKITINDHWEDDQPSKPFFDYTYCPGCNSSIIKQKKNLEVKRKNYKKDFYDVAWSHEDEEAYDQDFIFFVSDKLRMVLEEYNIKGIEFRPLYYYRNKEQLKNMYQMRIHNLYEYYDIIEYPRGEYKVCSICNRGIEIKHHINYFSLDIDGEYILRKELYNGEDIFLLIHREQWEFETEKSERPSALSRVIITSQFFKILLKNKITGFWASPVHLK